MAQLLKRTNRLQRIGQLSIGLITVAALVSCADPATNSNRAGDNQTPDSTSETTELVIEEDANEEPEPEPQPDPAEELRNSIADEVEGANTEILDGLVSVHFTITGGLFSSGPSTLSARSDTKDIIALVKDSPWSNSTLVVTANSILVDSYGNENDREVLRVSYSPETISRINIDNIANHNVWIVADDSFVHPAIGGI